jgi:hypothetical protein
MIEKANIVGAVATARLLKNAPKPTGLAKPRYIDKDANGAIRHIYCKVCGTVIATYEGPRAVRYNKNYTEIKIKFDDGSFHVTNLGSECLRNVRADKNLLLQVYLADMENMLAESPDLGNLSLPTNPKIVAFNIGTQGIP